jgi:pimeloyl-ACP methyl ester carboxylesterase
MAPAAPISTGTGTIRPDHSASVFVTAPDGLTLHVRRYGSRVASALPVVCLPGLARTAADFHPVAGALAADPAQPRLILALDYRGHGRSEYDRNADNYTLPAAKRTTAMLMDGLTRRAKRADTLPLRAH